MRNAVSMQNPADGFPIEFTNAARVLGRYDSTVAEAVALSTILPLHSHSRVLDLCCGFGRVAGQLHAMRYTVTGIDLSTDQIELASRENPGPTYLVGDMRELPTGETYDAIVNMFTSFGYFETEDEDIAALSGWCAALRKGGILVMELADMDRARARLDRKQAVIYRHTGDVVEECVMDWSRRVFKVKYLRHGSTFTCYTRLFEKEALKAHLHAAGFTDVQLHGGLDLRPKCPEDNLVIVATK